MRCTRVIATSAALWLAVGVSQAQTPTAAPDQPPSATPAAGSTTPAAPAEAPKAAAPAIPADAPKAAAPATPADAPKTAAPAAPADAPKTAAPAAPADAPKTAAPAIPADAPKAAAPAAPADAPKAAAPAAPADAPKAAAPATPPETPKTATPAAPADAPKAAAPAAPAQPPAAKVAAPPPPPPTPRLAVDAGSGAFADAYRKTVLEPFARETDIEITPAGAAGKAAADVLVLDRADLEARCKSGELETLDEARLAPTATRAQIAASDLLRLQSPPVPCGRPWLTWSRMFVYDPARFRTRAPQSLADVFNVKRFPGKRALPSDGRGLVELLLAADGVKADAIYPTLETLEGVRRAMKRLAAMGDDVIWYDSLPEAIALIRQGKAAIALTSNAHAFIEQARSGPLDMIDAAQVVSVHYLAVDARAREGKHARQLVAYATAPERMAALAALIPYGPINETAVRMTSRHAVTGQDLKPFLPTSPQNIAGAIVFDPVWWKSNGERLDLALKVARQGPPPPTRR